MPSATPPALSGVDVVLCRGCCCGNPAKHPGTDHEQQAAALAAAVAGVPGARLVTTNCLGPCELANVVVIRRRAPGPGAARKPPLWLGSVSDPADTAALSRWIQAIGSSGRTNPEADAELPARLADLRIPAPGPGTPRNR